MKKLMIVAAAALCATVFADVESSNTVGYSTKTIGAGKYQILGIQFDSTSGTALGLNEALTIPASAAVASWASMEDENCIPNWYKSAVHIMIPKGTVSTGYTDLYYTSNAYDMETSSFKAGWADKEGYYVSSASFLSGHALWLQNATAANVDIQVAGQVKASASDTLSFEAGYNLMKLPYPMALNADSTKIAWGLSATAPKAWNSIDDENCIANWYKSAVHLMIPKGTVDKGYEDLYYTQNAYDMGTLSFVEGWADKEGYLVTGKSIPEGFGFWIQTSAAFTATVAQYGGRGECEMRPRTGSAVKFCGRRGDLSPLGLSPQGGRGTGGLSPRSSNC